MLYVQQIRFNGMDLDESTKQKKIETEGRICF